MQISPAEQPLDQGNQQPEGQGPEQGVTQVPKGAVEEQMAPTAAGEDDEYGAGTDHDDDYEASLMGEELEQNGDRPGFGDS